VHDFIPDISIRYLPVSVIFSRDTINMQENLQDT